MQHYVSERQQVHDRNMLGQHQAIGARNRNACRLQRADYRLEQWTALPHQDEDIARADTVTLWAVADQVAPCEPLLHRGGDLARQLYPRAGGGLEIERRVPGVNLFL